MRYSAKSVIISVILAIIIAFPWIPSEAAVNVPETVRIGIYYRDTSESNNTAVNSFNASAGKGMQLGFVKGGKFTEAYEETGADVIIIRKDAYFYKNGNVLSLYDPAKTIPQGERFGPYHVKLGKDFANAEKAEAQIEKYEEEGIKAYLVFQDTWQVWTGFYIDRNSAEKEINDNILKCIPDTDCTVIEPSADRIVATTKTNEAVFLFGGSAAQFQVRPRKENSPYALKINENTYRGNIEVRRFASSDMTVINVLSMQEYLYGVVPPEIGAGSPLEALKAQAVVARTYTLGNIHKHESLDFNLCNTTWCQVYHGYIYNGKPVESAASNKAVDETEGEVVTYDGKLTQVFYFSSSGGRTEDSKNVFYEDLPYLKSVEDKYETGKTYKYNWVTEYTAEDIKKTMLSRKFDLGDITGVKVTKRSAAGRAIEVVVQGTKSSRVYTKEGCRTVLSNLYGQWYTITTDTDIFARSKETTPVKTQVGGMAVATSGGVKKINTPKKNTTVLGANGVRNNVPAVPTKYTFTGKGWGHAVGMSQDGAIGMAKAGFTYDQILTHYFTGTKIE